jgi:hypothetical protein
MQFLLFLEQLDLVRTPVVGVRFLRVVAALQRH